MSFIEKSFSTWIGFFTAAYCGWMVVQLVVRFKHIQAYFKAIGGQKELDSKPLLLGVFRPFKFSTSQFRALHVMLIVTLVLVLANIFPAACLALASVLSLLFFQQIWNLSYVHSKANFVPIILFLLSLSSEGIHPSSESTWPLDVIKVLLVIVYFSAGISKIRICGLRWASGEPLRAYLVEHYLYSDTALAMKFARYPLLCRLASTGALCFELSAPILVFVPKLHFYFVAIGITFHFLNYFLMKIDFFSFFMAAYLCFIPDLMSSSSHFKLLVPTPGPAFVGYIIILISALCAFTGRYAWPFQPFAYYSRWASLKALSVYRLAVSHDGEEWAWWQPIDSYQSKWFYYRFGRLLRLNREKAARFAVEVVGTNPGGNVKHNLIRVVNIHFKSSGAEMETIEPQVVFTLESKTLANY